MTKEARTTSLYAQSGTTRDPRESKAELDPPRLVDPLDGGNEGPHDAILYPGAMRDDGAVIRIPVYEGMQTQDVIELHWKGNESYESSLTVLEADRFVDFKVPKRLVLANSEPGKVISCPVSYTVRRHNSDEVTTSPLATIHVVTNSPAPPPVKVPAAPEGELDFSTISPEVGLAVDFPDTFILIGRWLCYGKDGRPKDLVRFGALPGETLHMWRELLEQVERGGEVRIWYTGDVEYISPSMNVSIRAL